METWLKKIILFLTSQTITLVGSTVVGYAVIWYITLETSSGAMMAIGVACNYLPLLLISPFAGVWADRYNKKFLIIAADAFTAIMTLLLAILWLTGSTNFAFIFIIIALRSLGSGIQQPAVNALIPEIVPVEHLTRINAVNSTIMNILTLLAPALGGALLASGFVNALLFDTGTAALGIVVLLFLKINKVVHNEEQETEKLNVKQDMLAGLAYVKRTDWLRFMLIFYGVGFFLMSPGMVLSPILIERIFDGAAILPMFEDPDVWLLTFNEMAWSVGAIIGGVVIAIWGGFKNRVFSIVFTFLIFGAGFGALGLVSNYWWFIGLMAFAGLFLPLFSTAETTFIQEKTDPKMMGRVFSILNIMVSAAVPLAMVIFGPLADVIDIRTIFVACGVLMVALAIYIMSNKKYLAYDKDGRPPMNRKRKATEQALPSATENISEESE